MKIGDIDVTNSIINLEHDVNVLQQVLEYIIRNNPTLKGPTQKEVNSMKDNALEILNKKYPNMGIKKN